MRRISREVAEKIWRERRAKEKGRVPVPGLDAVMARFGVTNADLAWQVGVSESTVREWRKLGSKPNEARRMALAELLGVSMEELEDRREVGRVRSKAS